MTDVERQKKYRGRKRTL